jgi:hypothetical protein
MIGAVRITKVDALSENFAYQWARKGCYNSFLRTGNSGCFLMAEWLLFSAVSVHEGGPHDRASFTPLSSLPGL